MPDLNARDRGFESCCRHFFFSQIADFIQDLGLNFITKSWIVHLREFSGIWALHWVQKISGRTRFLGVKWLFWNRNLKTIPSEYRDILYLILKVLIRSLKWGTVRLWTPTGCKDTSRQSWRFEKNVRFRSKTEVFFERSTLTAGIFESSGSSETYCTSF